MLIDCEDISKEIENLQADKIAIFYGDGGVGKTHHLRQYCIANDNVLYVKSDSVGYTFKPIEEALLKKTGKEITSENNSYYICTSIEEIVSELKRLTIIIDDFSINNSEMFKFLFKMKKSTLKEKLKIIICINRKSLDFEEEEFFAEFNAVPFKVKSSIKSIKKEFRDRIKLMSDDDIDRCASSSMDNFSVAKRLAFHISINDNGARSLEDLIVDFYRNQMGKDIKNLEGKDQDILLKSSVVGKRFSTDILESESTFSMMDVADDLFRIEKYAGYVHRTGNNNNFEFDEDHVHKGILKNVEAGHKKSWNRLFADYYLKRSETKNRKESSAYLERALNHLKLCDDNSYLEICYVLYRYYARVRDLKSQLRIIDDILSSRLCDEVRFYILSQKVQLCNNCENYRESVEILNSMLDYDLKQISPTTKLYLEYYLSYSKYNAGLAPEALDELKSLENKLNRQLSNRDYIEKHLLCLVYSQLASSLKNLDDDKDKEAIKYYEMALNIAKNISRNVPDIYYKILRKCSMFYDPETRVDENLKHCVNYFEGINNHTEYAKSLHNLATNRLFLYDLSQNTSSLFNRSRKTMEERGIKDLSAVCNNMGILHAMKGDCASAEDSFNRCLLYETECFSRFSALSNLFNLYIMENRIEEAKDIYSKIERIHQYQSNIENSNFMYRAYYLIDSYILEEHEGKNLENMEKLLKELEEICVTNFFKTILGGLQSRMGVPQIDCSCPYPLLKEFGLKGIFFAEILFWE